MRKDGRHRRRYLVVIPCRFAWEHGSVDGYLRNLSMGGAFVRTLESPPVGTLGELLVKHDGDHSFQVTAKVVHTGPLSAPSGRVEGFGLCFTHFGGEGLGLLQDLLRDCENP